MALFLLQEDGSRILLEDGTSRVLLEEEGGPAAQLRRRMILGHLDAGRDDYLVSYFI